MDLPLHVEVPSSRRRWLVIGAVTGGVLLAVAGVSGHLAQQRERQQQRLEAQTAAVVRKDVVIKVSAAGSIKPLNPVNISPKAAGKVVALLVDQGDKVKAGQVLARMDASNLQGPLLRARGNLAAARDNLREAQAQLLAIEATYRSNSKLFAAGAVSHNDYTASRGLFLATQSHIRALRGQVAAASGDLETAQAAINDTVIRAPFSGDHPEVRQHRRLRDTNHLGQRHHLGHLLLDPGPGQSIGRGSQRL